MIKKFLLTAITLVIAAAAVAQDSSSSSVVRRRGAADRGAKNATPGVTQRMQSHLASSGTDDSELQWMRVMYRELDLTKDENGALYYPDEPVEGQDNLFRIIMRHMADGSLGAYEYLDGREVFNDDFRVKMRDVLDRFHIIYSDAKGSTEKNPKFTIEEADVPASEVLSYYVIEKWEFDKRSNRMRTVVEAICPVLHRAGDFGGEAVKYPMFWVKFSDLRPYLAQQQIFISDDNNLPTCTYDDFFNLTMYEGDIYKTRNLRNRSMMQMYPDPDDMKRAQDSIQTRLDKFEEKLWVPDREEIIAAREARERMAAGDTTAVVKEDKAAKAERRKSARSTSRSKKKSTKVKETKIKTDNSSSAAKSVRRRKK